MPDLKNFRSDWNNGDPIGWSCSACNWTLSLNGGVLNITSIGSAVTEYLSHECPRCKSLMVSPQFANA